MRSVLLPNLATPAARDILVEVLPVPPFCEAMDVIIGVNPPKT